MKRLPFLILAGFLTAHLARGEIIQLDPESSIFEKQLPLPYLDGAGAEDILAQWGIWVHGVGSTPVMRQYYPPANITPPIFPYIVNEAVSGTSAGKPLILDARHPFMKVIIGFRTTRDDAEVTLQLFDPLGTIVGTVVVNFQDGFPTFVFLESTEQPISRIIVDYGEAEEAE